MMRLAGHLACMGGKRDAYKSLVQIPEEKGALGSLMNRWKDIE
jgi:hypothetical protein